MIDRACEDSPANQIYLHPGQMFAGSGPVLVTTILGSCIAVCLWDPVARVAGINHFLLPKNPLRGQDDARYGDTAMDALLVRMWKLGAAIDRIVAKVFGGACILRTAPMRSMPIGTSNAVVARQFLAGRHIEIVADQCGGDRGRKLLFDASDGTAWVKEI